MIWEKKRVLVTVKAYPERSRKYGPVVCIMGLTEEGEWIRLYPLTLDVFSGKDKLRKYDWIEVECKKAEEKLQKSEDNLNEAQRIAKIGSWDFEIPTQNLAPKLLMLSGLLQIHQK